MAKKKPKNPASKKGGRGVTDMDDVAVAAALATLHGNISSTAKQFSVHRSSLAEYIQGRPILVQVLKDAKEGMIDHAESSLYRAVLEGESWAVCFFLKTQAKSRGYIEKIKDDEPLAALQAQINELRKYLRERNGDAGDTVTRVVGPEGDGPIPNVGGDANPLSI